MDKYELKEVLIKARRKLELIIEPSVFEQKAKDNLLKEIYNDVDKAIKEFNTKGGISY